MEEYLTSEDIADVEITQCSQVYDLTVKDNHNYMLDVGKKELVHNSGKTFIIVRNIILRALKYPNTRHLSVRNKFNHAKQSLWLGTIPDVLKVCFPQVTYVTNKTDFYITFPNGSEYWVGGTDDKERVEKVLGNEYATIHINEAVQIDYNTYEMLRTRLNPPQGVPARLFIDYNPSSKKHWGYQMFHLGLKPNTKMAIAHKDNYAFIKMNPADNMNNLSESYLETLNELSEKQKRRFLYGEYTDDTEGALWKREWIDKTRLIEAPDMHKIVVAVDPAVSNTETSDDTGIIVCGVGLNGEYYVLDDETYHGDVTGWGSTVSKEYEKWQADRVVAESNQGGDLVKMNIRNYNRNIPITMVRATRGKALRAEPIADLYDRGLVHHVGYFSELEDELCTWTPLEKVSPNRLDAVVWGLTYLSRGSVKMAKPSNINLGALGL